MEQAFMKAEIREKAGSKRAARLLSQGRLPATIYGHKQSPESVSVDAHEFGLQLQHGHRLFDLDLNGASQKALIKDIQFDYLGKSIIHIDFIRVDLSERVRVSIGIELKGIAKGALEGGIIEGHLDEVELECLVTDIPESVVVSVKEIGIGDVIHASDLKLPEGAKLVTDPKAIIVTCNLVTEAKTAEEIEGEGSMEPEVITERKQAQTEENA